MELINKIRKSRKGFTLVEIIVVLVILAVLAAFTIPSMIGFVNDAKKKAAIAEQREVYVAAQAIATEYVAKFGPTAAAGTDYLGISTTTGDTLGEAVNLGSAAVIADAKDAAKKMKGYLGSDISAGNATSGAVWRVFVNSSGQVDRVTYTRDGIKLDDLLPSSVIKPLT